MFIYGNYYGIFAANVPAAFDAVDHIILLNRLERRLVNGVKSTASFLELRKAWSLDQLFFPLYVTPLEDIIAKHRCQTNIHGRHPVVHVTCNSINSVTSLESCVDEIMI